MLAKNYKALNAYLGFNAQDEAEVPASTGKAKVVRKKSTGDWRHWFTPEDVERYQPAYTPYMEMIGYDSHDWLLSANPVIEPEYSSMYMQRLALRKKKTWYSILGFKDRLVRQWTIR
jgi:hypothetical protein